MSPSSHWLGKEKKNAIESSLRSKYINDNGVDYINARRVVNADVTLNGNKIAAEAEQFEQILKKSITVTHYI